MKKRIKTSFKKSKARSNFDEGSQPSRKAMNTSYLGKTKKYWHFFWKKSKSIKNWSIGRNGSRSIGIDSSRSRDLEFANISKKIIEKTTEIIDFWILAGFWGITMDSENHGSWSNADIVPSWTRSDLGLRSWEFVKFVANFELLPRETTVWAISCKFHRCLTIFMFC